MIVQVWFMSHPVGAESERGVWGNLQRAARWLRWLRLRCPNVTIIAPWLGPLLAGTEDDSNAEDRERGLRDCCAVVERCDGIILCGGRISSGMQRELDACCDHGQGYVADLTSLGDEPPADYDEKYQVDGLGYEQRDCPLEVGMYAWEAK